jgi:predicted DNA-binding transcriptional regulator YafY
MAKKLEQERTVTAERAARLHRLLKMLAVQPQTRDVLRRQLRMDVRSFYRDLEVLRTCGIELPLRNRRYVLETDEKTALGRLPFPDPHFSLCEALQLAQGRTPAHRKLKALIELVVGKKEKTKKTKKKKPRAKTA